jgi:16S rRNA (guanine(966)-N(2))-methyltransferase RsmD
MRIVGGLLKGIRFQVPKAFDSRPTTDFAKEALFNILGNHFNLDQCDVLDLFTGTGSLSLEFASRQVKSVIGVDRNVACLRFIGDICKKHKLSQVKLLKNDAITFLKIAEIQFDIILADPPYEYKYYEEIITNTFSRKLLKPKGMLILEHGRQNDFSNHEKFLFLRNYGGVHFSFFADELPANE